MPVLGRTRRLFLPTCDKSTTAMLQAFLPAYRISRLCIDTSDGSPPASECYFFEMFGTIPEVEKSTKDSEYVDQDLPVFEYGVFVDVAILSHSLCANGSARSIMHCS